MQIKSWKCCKYRIAAWTSSSTVKCIVTSEALSGNYSEGSHWVSIHGRCVTIIWSAKMPCYYLQDRMIRWGHPREIISWKIPRTCFSLKSLTEQSPLSYHQQRTSKESLQCKFKHLQHDKYSLHHHYWHGKFVNTFKNIIISQLVNHWSHHSCYIEIRLKIDVVVYYF